MDKDAILKITSESMKAHLDELTLDNLEMKEKIMNEYFEFIKSLRVIQLPTLVVKVEEKLDEMLEGNNDTNVSEETNNEVETDLMKPKRIAYRFEEKLKGGELPEIGAFVPQRVVKENNLIDGDFLFAQPLEISEPYEGPKRYSYELAERGNGIPARGIKRFEKCKVEKMLNRLNVAKTINDESVYVLEDMEHPLFISEKDMREFGLEEGSIVDIAYYENKPQDTIRVTWNYTTEDREEYLSPKPSSFYKALKKDSGEKTQIEEDFTGKTILMIGCEPKRADYRDIVEKRGGDFIWASGKEGEDRLQSMIRKSDYVLMNLVHVSHRGTWKGVEYCKKHGIPHEQIDNFGNSTFLRTVTEMISEEEKQDKIV